MDCAVCAKKLETAVSKLDGVKSVNVNFMAGKMTLDYDETATDLFGKIKKTAKDLEPDWELGI